MSDYVPNANQEEFTEFFDWTKWEYDWEGVESLGSLEGGSVVEMGGDR